MEEEDLFTEDENKEIQEQMKVVEGLDLSSIKSTEDILNNYQDQYKFDNENTIDEKNQIPESNTIIQKRLDLKLHKDKKDCNNSNWDSNVETVFPYIDEKGIERYRIKKLHKPDKNGNKYVVESYKEDGSTKPGAQGIPRIPYNVPQMLKQKGRVIFVVNGEDKVETMKKLGFVATTAAFSSPEKWKQEFNKYLVEGCYIIILADNKEDSSYTRFLDNTLEVIQEDYENVGRIDLVDYFDFFGVEVSNVKTLTDLVQVVPKEKVIEFFSNIENQLKGGVA